MSDEVQELEQQVDGVGEEGVAEERQPEPTAQAETPRQPEKPKVNLDEFDEFRQWKSQQDKRAAETERQYQQRLAAMEQQMRQYQYQLEQTQTAEMDDYDKLEYQLNKERQEKQQYAQRLLELEVQQAKHQALSNIATKLHVPIEALAEAGDYQEAIDLAMQYREQSEQQRAAQAAAEAQRKATEKAQRAAANRPDTGAPAAPGTPDRFKGAKTAVDLAKLYWQSQG